MLEFKTFARMSGRSMCYLTCWSPLHPDMCLDNQQYDKKECLVLPVHRSSSSLIFIFCLLSLIQVLLITLNDMDIATASKLSQGLIISAVFNKKENFLLSSRDGVSVVYVPVVPIKSKGFGVWQNMSCLFLSTQP